MSENALALSDEEFEKLPVPTVEDTSTEASEAPTSDADSDADTQVTQGEEDGLQDQETNEDTSTQTEEVSSEEEEESTKESNVEEQEEPTLDYKAAYEEVFKPFKANGKEMRVDNVEDVRQLMQMGANYNKKMAALKPSLKLMKMLENNGLLDEAKLGYLIDLDKKNPDAVKRLIKEAGIDPLDIDINEENNYKPNTYNVNDKELELDAVLSEIKETDTFNSTIDIIGNKWDESSKLVLLDNPGLIKVINQHVGNGVYEAITNEVERLRVLGKLEGMSDIDAYKAVGDVMYAPRANAPMANTITKSTSKATNKEDPRLNDKRKAASTTKSVASNVKPNFNPLAMSDEEFEKIASSKFI